MNRDDVAVFATSSEHKMPSPNSITALPVVGLSLLCAVATWALVQAAGEGKELEMVNYPYAIALSCVIFPSVFYFLTTWFVPSAFPSSVVSIYRTLRVILGLGMFAMIFALVGAFAAIWITSESTTSVAVVFFCISLARYGFGLACLTMLAGGIIGIAIDLFVVASRIRLPKARCR